MRYTSFILAIMLLPAFAAAEDGLVEYMQQVMDRTGNGSGTVIETHSSASTGGQVVRGGQTVVTDGDVSASSHVETHINTGNSGGTVHVKTETTKNGETKKEEYTKTVGPNEAVEVNVSAEARAEGTHSEVQVDGQTDAAAGASTSSEESIEREAPESRVEEVFKAVPGFFKRIFTFFWRW